jgi:3-phenylpropionate/trans-cinnamate dioxygenase ferredoxin reductase subunit
VKVSHGSTLLVIGAGHAAVQLVSALREGGYDQPVTLVGDENHLPYQRPTLSKSFLNDDADVELQLLRAASFYRDNAVQLITGERVAHVDLQPAGNGTAHCRSGRELGFGRLVLATGARARSLVLPGASADGVHVLRDVDDAAGLRADLATAEDVVVLGAGFIGLEVAATVRAQGKRVTVVEAAAALLGRSVGTHTAEHVRRWHRGAGISFRLSAVATRIVARGGRVSGVELDDGSVLPAQVVVVGVGAQPRTRLAEQAGLQCADGVLVDTGCRASDGVTLAIGDCARAPDASPQAGPGATLRLESVDSADEQAKAAAATILGRAHQPRAVPWFWSDQGSLKVQVAGLRAADDVAVVRDYGDGRRLTTLYYRADRLVAAETVNAPADALLVRRELEQGRSLPRALAQDPGRPVKELITR